ncbi:Acetyltransferase (isoleucine patch superfamily) [Bacteroidales bacterium KHT7]|nr:Acetyltransferase (isoleucine patch superfamily) [Bacteroidales bacterium KHT7]
MIQIRDKAQCCGCNACGDICSRGSITFKTDIEGFWYPVVNMDTCIDCHLCEKVCPIINIKELKKNDSETPLKSFAAIHKNMRIRWDSTSGGAYSALAEAILEQGGYISGAIYNDGFTGVHNYVTNKPEELEKLRSSKYLQSNAEGIFKEIKQLLTKGEKVLACGTPCQMAALRRFLHRDYEDLIIVDFICRGVNSPKVYRAYLDALEKKYGSKVVYVKAKNKELGWRNLTRKVTFANGTSYYGILMDDDFRRGYHTNAFCRPSCYDCKFKGFPRISDITIADFWGIEKVNPALDNNIGTSMILLNSNKGAEYFKKIVDRIVYSETTFEQFVEGNGALYKSLDKPTIDRVSLFNDLDTYGFDYITRKYFPLVEKMSLKRKVRRLLKPYALLLLRLGFSPSIWLKFLKINFRKHTKSSIKKEYYIIPSKSTVFDIHPSAIIDIKKTFIYGNETVRGLRIPTALRMEKHTKLIIHDGPITRYGIEPYNLRYGAYIEIVNGGQLTLGQGAANVGLTIMCAERITIGNNVRMGRNVSIRDWNGSHVIISDTYKNGGPVTIGDQVWLCTGCTILPGVTIGDGAVVAANAVVTKDVPPHTLVAGAPAKTIKENIKWY